MRLCAERDLPAGRQGLVSQRLIRLGRKLFFLWARRDSFLLRQKAGALHTEYSLACIQLTPFSSSFPEKTKISCLMTRDFTFLWARRDSNPHSFRNQFLRLARIPIPPPARYTTLDNFCLLTKYFEEVRGFLGHCFGIFVLTMMSSARAIGMLLLVEVEMYQEAYFIQFGVAVEARITRLSECPDKTHFATLFMLKSIACSSHERDWIFSDTGDVNFHSSSWFFST